MAGKGGAQPGAGRPKGSLSKKTIEAQEIADRLGVNPFELLLYYATGNWKKLGYSSETVLKYSSSGDTYTEPVISPELRASSAGKACEYLYPKRKAIEHTADATTVENITRTILYKPVEHKS